MRSGGKQPSHPERPRRLVWPRTSPFHGGNTGSNPVGDAKFQHVAETLCKLVKIVGVAGFEEVCFWVIDETIWIEHLLHLNLLVERSIPPRIAEVDRLLFPLLD